MLQVNYVSFYYDIASAARISIVFSQHLYQNPLSVAQVL